MQWAVAYPRLKDAADSSMGSIGEKAPLLPTPAGADEAGVKNSSAARSGNKLMSALAKAVFNPPTMTMVVAAVIGCIPYIPEHLFLSPSAPLNTVLNSLNALGLLVVYFSPVVLGAEVYMALKRSTSSSAVMDRPELRFGHTTIASITLLRLVILPALGRQFYYFFSLGSWIESPLLGLFVLEQTNVNTASMAMLMIMLLGANFQRSGDLLRKDVASVLLLQFVMAPVVLTLNTALALSITYPYQ